MSKALFTAGGLVIRAGKLVFSTCAACCGVCKLYYKCEQCPPRPRDPNDPCPYVEPPIAQPVYVPVTSRCDGRPIRPTDVIRVDGKCYGVTPQLFRRPTDVCPQPSLPNGSLIIEDPECVPNGCADPRCLQATGYGVARTCDPDSGYPLVYFCIGAVTRCFYSPISPDSTREPRCYIFEPTATSLPPPAGTPVITSFLGESMFASCCECTASIIPDGNGLCKTCLTGKTVRVDSNEPITTFGPQCCIDLRASCSMTVSGYQNTIDAFGNEERITIPEQTVRCDGTQNALGTRRLITNGVITEEDNQEFPSGQGNCPVNGFWDDANAHIQNVTITFNCTSWRYVGFSEDGAGGRYETGFTIIVNRGTSHTPCAGSCGASSALPVLQAVPVSQRPTWANAVAKMSRPGEVGVGDTVARLIGSGSSNAFKKWFKSFTGFDCGCDGRRSTWNMLYSYDTTSIG